MELYEEYIKPIIKILTFFILATVMYIPAYAGLSYAMYLLLGYDAAAAIAWVVVYPLLGVSSWLLYKTRVGKRLADI